jgi:glycosyltransferase involved in cell wall biosynthesis
MRIAFPMFGIGRTGGEKVISKLANAACRRGHDVTFLVSETNGAFGWDTSANIQKVPSLPIVRRLPRVKTLARSFPLSMGLRGFDAIVANFAPTCLPAKMAGGEKVKRYYLVQHDETIFFSPLSFEYWVTRLSYAAFEENRVFVVSRWLQDMVRRRGGPQPILLSPGIDHASFYPRDRTAHSGKHVMVLARDEKWKGLRVFVDAMESVRKEVDDVKIIAVGRTRDPLKTSCPIEYVHPSDNELARLYSSCDAYVLPSIIEGLGAPPLEAMACGGAVIATDCLGTRDFAVNEVNSLVVPPGDSAALSQAIVRVLTDDALSRELRKNGPGTAAPWTYERMESIFLRTLESG